LAYLWIAFGSALGGAARYWCYDMMARLLGETFPWGTLAVNILGCTFIGFFAAMTGPEGRILVGVPVRQFVMPGICGGFTTFSTFSLETLSLARDGEWLKAAANVASSVLFCLVGVWLGHTVASSLSQS